MTESIDIQQTLPHEWNDVGIENYLRLNVLVDNQLRLTGRGCPGVLVDMLTGKLAKQIGEMAEISKISKINNLDITRQTIATAMFIGLSAKSDADIEKNLLATQTSVLGSKGTTGSPTSDLQIDNVLRLTKIIATKIMTKQLAIPKK
jgi:hypothetical protein